MLYTQQSVMDNIRNREGRRVFYLGRGDQLTASAREYLSRERIDILSADMAKKESYRLLNGAVLEQKPEQMTHLNAEVLVLKTHPRILLRGALDTLESELLLCQLVTDAQISQCVGQILDFARQIIRSDVLNEPFSIDSLCGLTQAELRRRSHFPQEYYNQAHFMPSKEDGHAILQLNRARCAARQAELYGVAAFTDTDGNPTREDILRALNRMSSMLYILMIQCKAKKSLG